LQVLDRGAQAVGALRHCRSRKRAT
jgi:hypothetical protein